MIQLLVHDLKSPLNTILGFAEMSTDQTTGRYITSAGQKMLNLVLTLLEVSKFESDTLKLFLTRANFYDLLTSAREQIVLELEIKKIKFDYNGPLINVKADKQLIYRVLVNLLTNAVKYTPPGGRVEVKVEVTDGRAFISVSDTGPGIAAEHLPNIFDRFYNYNAKNLGRTPSTGLGLHFCKLAVEAHGGSIKVDSRPGEGTTFTFDLEAVGFSEAQPAAASSSCAEHSLDDDARALLAPFVKKMHEMQIFETTRILAVLDQIPAERPEIKRWKTEVANAVFSCNAKDYMQMMDAVLNLEPDPL
jgi:signal transduction histidine kinase